MQLTERTRIRNHPERAVPDETSEILAQGMVAYLGFIQDDTPYVIPFTYHYDGSARPIQSTCTALYAAARSSISQPARLSA